MYDLKEANIQVDWSTQEDQFPELEFENVPAAKIGYDQTGNGNGQSAFVEGWQYRNSNLIFAFDRIRPIQVPVLDANLVAAIRAELGYSLTRPITFEDVASLVKLSATNISTLSGLEYFTNLKALSLSDSSFSDISVLASLTNLTRVCLKNNDSLTDLAALLTLPELEVVNIQDIAPTRLTALQAKQLNLAAIVIENQGLLGAYVRGCLVTAENGDGKSIAIRAYLRHNTFTNEDTLQLGLVESIWVEETPVQARFLSQGIEIGTVVLAGVPAILGHTITYTGLYNDMTVEIDTAETEAYLTGDCTHWMYNFDTSGPPTVTFTGGLLAAMRDHFFLESSEDVELLWVQKMRTLDASRHGVTGLTGISEAQNLTALDLSFNSVTNVSSLSGLPLTSLNLMHNPSLADLSSLDLGAMTYCNIVGLSVTEPAGTNILDPYNQGIAGGCVVDADIDRDVTLEVTLDKISGERAVPLAARITASYSRRTRSFSGLLELSDETTSVIMYETDPDDPFYTATSLVNTILEVDDITLPSNPLLVTLEEHGLESGQQIRIANCTGIAEVVEGRAYTIEKINDDSFTLLGARSHTGDTFTEAAVVYSPLGITHATLAALPDAFFIQAVTADESVLRYHFEFDPLPSRTNGLQDCSMTSTNEVMQARTITGATNSDPITVTISGTDLFDDGALIDVANVNGNVAANGRWEIVNGDPATSFDLVGSVGSGTYSTGGTATPVPLTLEVPVTTRLVRNPFLDYYIFEITFNFEAASQQIEDSDGYCLISLPATIYNLVAPEIDRISYVTGVDQLLIFPTIRAYTATYNLGALATPQENVFSSDVDFNDAYVKLVTSLQVEGLDLADLVITLPADMSQPKMVGPIQAIFNTQATVDGTLYSDLVRLEFASDIVGATPIDGLIKVCAMQVGEA